MRLEDHVVQLKSYSQIAGGRALQFKKGAQTRRPISQQSDDRLRAESIQKISAAIAALPAGARRSQLQNELHEVLHREEV